MSLSVSYSSTIVCITPPRFDAILSEKSGRGFSRFYFRGIKASAEERVVGLLRLLFKACRRVVLLYVILGICIYIRNCA